MTNHSMLSDDSHAVLDKALDLAGGDRITARRLLTLISETNRTTLTYLRESLEAASFERAGSAAHRIAGSARILECPGLLALLMQLEAAAGERDIVRATAVLPPVIEALDQLDVSITRALGNDG